MAFTYASDRDLASYLENCAYGHHRYPAGPSCSPTPSSVSLASTTFAPAPMNSSVLDLEIAEEIAVLEELKKELGTEVEDEKLEQAIIQREVEALRIRTSTMWETPERETKKRYKEEARPVTKKKLQLRQALKENAEAKAMETKALKEIRRQITVLEDKIRPLEDPKGSKHCEFEDVCEAFKEAKLLQQHQVETNEALERNEEERESELNRLNGEAREKENEWKMLTNRHRFTKEIFEALKSEIEGKEKKYSEKLRSIQDRSFTDKENSEKIPEEIEVLAEEITNELKPRNRKLAVVKNREIKNLHEAMHKQGLTMGDIAASLETDEVAKLYSKINNRKMELAMLRSWNDGIHALKGS